MFFPDDAVRVAALSEYGAGDVQVAEVLGRVRGECPLLELVKTRVSQINGCAFGIDMHTKDARAAGESEQRLYGLSAWREVLRGNDGLRESATGEGEG
jgi:AhpD family alkylhydroperoxidase